MLPLGIANLIPQSKITGVRKPKATNNQSEAHLRKRGRRCATRPVDGSLFRPLRKLEPQLRAAPAGNGQREQAERPAHHVRAQTPASQEASLL